MSVVVSRAKLAAVLGMMGSDHDGEVLSAARTAERLRRATNLTWSQLLIGPDAGADLPWRELLDMARSRPELLSQWDRQFLTSIATQRTLSIKQQAVLRRIAERARAA